jgi:uncharacterized protein (TIGR00290 family)
LSWSSGKDSAWTLHLLREQGAEVVGLLTTFNQAFDRVAMHAVRRSLLDAQADRLGLPLHVVEIPSPCPNEVYEQRMAQTLASSELASAEAVAFGDLFLEDIRRYREDRLAPTRVAPLFPLWGLPTDALARDMVRAGLRARLTCVDPRHLAPSFAGREFDAELLAALPVGVDPCGERGEFHTFAYGGPMFGQPVPVRCGDIVEREGFVFADLLEETGPV